eukprot:gene6918-30899_t
MRRAASGQPQFAPATALPRCTQCYGDSCLWQPNANVASLGAPNATRCLGATLIATATAASGNPLLLLPWGNPNATLHALPSGQPLMAIALPCGSSDPQMRLRARRGLSVRTPMRAALPPPSGQTPNAARFLGQPHATRCSGQPPMRRASGAPPMRRAALGQNPMHVRRLASEQPQCDALPGTTQCDVRPLPVRATQCQRAASGQPPMRRALGQPQFDRLLGQPHATRCPWATMPNVRRAAPGTPMRTAASCTQCDALPRANPQMHALPSGTPCDALPLVSTQWRLAASEQPHPTCDPPAGQPLHVRALVKTLRALP